MYGVFITPKMRSILYKMESIETAAASRGNNGFFPPYTWAEMEELKKLHHEYLAEKEMEGL